MKHIAISLAVLMLVWAGDAHAKTTYHCGYQGVKHMVMKKYVKAGNNIKDVDSAFDYKILEDNESGLVLAHGSTVGGFYLAVILINKKNMSFTRHSIGHDGEQLKMTGQCRRE